MILHSKQSTKPNTIDVSPTQPSDWDSAHIIDSGSITSAMLWPTGVTAGTYTVSTLSVNVAGLITGVS